MGAKATTTNTAQGVDATFEKPIKNLNDPQCVEASKVASLLNSVASEGKIICVGNGWAKYKSVFAPHLRHNWQWVNLSSPQAELLAPLAITSVQPISWPELQAFYLSLSSAEQLHIKNTV